MSKNSHANGNDGGQGSRTPLVIDELATQTLDLADLLTKDVTLSGSFDIRGEIWATTFGKLLQAIPIPGMLIDESFKIAVLNQACAKISPEYESILSTSFCRLVPTPSNAQKMQSFVEAVFFTRRPKVVEAPLRIGSARGLWCRMTFRSVRIFDRRYLLVLIEDFSSEKEELARSKSKEEELRRGHQELEKRVNERTAQLTAANADLRREIAERQKAELALKEIVTMIEGQLKDLKEEVILRLRVSLQPLIDQLKAETTSTSGRHLLRALDYHLAHALSSFGTKPSQKLTLLTPKEVQTCNLIVSGLTSKQIAEATGVTVDAVNSYRLRIRKKLGLDLSRESLATWLKFQYGL
ncbi:MAG: hypothetical protein HY913_10535 [Desulfomonile tiedjei]|nr:hypothetical protein [Desulfomonile tiedjei]